MFAPGTSLLFAQAHTKILRMISWKRPRAIMTVTMTKVTSPVRFLDGQYAGYKMATLMPTYVRTHVMQECSH